MANKKIRLDLLCVEQGLAPSRTRAQALIAAGKVMMNGSMAPKAGTPVRPDAELTLNQPDHPYVSRGGLKLEAALDAFKLDVAGKVALDIGASTGGFTDCLLQRGAKHVIGVDVGYGQLAWKLRQDARVTCIERCNARNLELEMLQGAPQPELCVMDVSFISLTLVLPAIRKVLGPGMPIVAMIKPQFEAPRDDVGSGGVVRDPRVRKQAIDRVLNWAKERKYQLVSTVDSPITGPKGNLEHFAHLVTE